MMATACVLQRGENHAVDSLKLFSENAEDVYTEAYQVLLRYADNLLVQPNNPKYRKIKLKASVLQGLKAAAQGLEGCLQLLGYQEGSVADEEGLVFNATSDSLKIARNFRKSLVTMHDQKKRGEPYQNTTSLPTAGAPSLGGNTLLPSPQLLLNGHAPSQSVFTRIKASFEHVLIYEEPQLQKKARDYIPVRKLTMQASKKFLESRKRGSTYMLPDFLLLELLAWFKLEFFHWVDAPPCDFCGGKTRGIGSTDPLPVELMWWGNRVESYQCLSCMGLTRFPRYNHPGKLLETRRGRCGEWANCFALCSRAMGLETRYVLDFTDHVWVEVYSVSQKRWLHADPCENVCDTPFLYEAGWGKKLTYVFGFSKDDIQDVIWRYTRNHEETLKGRTECGEAWLAGVITRLRQQRQATLTDDRKKVVQDRLLAEMVEFFTPRQIKEDECIGRQSGSTEWKSQRGETGSGRSAIAIINPSIKITDLEKRNKYLHLRYCSASDTYQRPANDNSAVKGWHNMVYYSQNIMLKQEQDWKMVYLARKEKSTSASIAWRLEFKEMDSPVDDITLLVSHACFESGKIKWMIYYGCECYEINQGRRIHFKHAHKSEAKGMTIVAELWGGDGSNAWQHTQLFRQGMADNHIYPFDINIKFK